MSKILKWFYVVALAMCWGGFVWGQANSYTNTANGKWETPSNWSLSVPPAGNQSATLITNTVSKTVTIDSVTASNFLATLTISNLVLSAPAGSTNTLSVRIGDLASASPNPLTMDTLTINAGGSLIVSNSAITIATSNTINNGRMVFLNDTGQLGLLSSDNFAFTVTGSSGSYSNVGPIAFANANSNTILISNGARVDTDDLYIGFKLFGFFPLPANADLVTVTGTNSQLNIGLLSIGEVGSSNQFVIGDGATMRVKGLLTLSSDTTSISNLIKVLPGGTLIVGQNVLVGNSSGARATMEITGGTSTLFSNLVAGGFLNSTGTILVSGGQVVATNGVIGIGNNGTGTAGLGVGRMTVSNATVMAGTILLGSSVGGKGDLTIKANGIVTFDSSAAGTNAALVANDLILDGGLLQMTNATLYCGRIHPGAMLLSNGTAVCQNLYVGYDDAGTLTTFNGSMNVPAGFAVGHLGAPTTATGTVWITGGELISTNANVSTFIGNAGVGRLILSNGTLRLAKLVIANSSNAGTVTLAGGVLTADNVILTRSSGRLVFNRGQLVTGGITNANGQAFTVGDGSNPATLTLVGGVHTFANGLQVAANAFVTGCGQINGTVVNNGVITNDCGAAPLVFSGTVTNNGAIVVAPGGKIDFNGPLVNNGLVDGRQGVVRFNGPVTGSGSVQLNFSIDSDGDGQSDGAEAQAGTDPMNSGSSFRITGVAVVGTNMLVTWSCGAGHTNVVQLCGTDGNYSTNCVALSGPIILSGSGVVTTNYLHLGGVTGATNRFYRVRLVP